MSFGGLCVKNSFRLSRCFRDFLALVPGQVLSVGIELARFAYVGSSHLIAGTSASYIRTLEDLVNGHLFSQCPTPSDIQCRHVYCS